MSQKRRVYFCEVCEGSPVAIANTQRVLSRKSPGLMTVITAILHGSKFM